MISKEEDAELEKMCNKLLSKGSSMMNKTSTSMFKGSMGGTHLSNNSSRFSQVRRGTEHQGKRQIMNLVSMIDA